MTHITTSLCVRDRGCIDVCPVECMVPGPVAEWPWIYIDPSRKMKFPQLILPKAVNISVALV